jgi:hypothetical protein
VAAKGQHNLTPSIDWSDDLIGSGGLLLVLSHHLESRFHLAGEMGNNKSLILDVRFIVGGTNARYGRSCS